MTKRINIDEDPRNANWLHEARLRREKELKMKYEKKYYEYLDGLRESGVTNMFGAASYLKGAFMELDREIAKKILADWMKTFSQRHPKREGESV